MNHVIVVGGGISGLSVAHHIGRLAGGRSLAARVTVFESAARAGGRIGTERVEGFRVEMGANGFLDSKPSTLDLCRAVGLGSDLIRARPEARNRYLLWPSRLEKLPGSPRELLASRLLSFGGKLRLVAERWVRPRRDGPEETVHEFARRRFGREAAEVIADALVTGIHAGDPELLSAAATFPRLVQLEREHGSLLRAFARGRRQAPPRQPNDSALAEPSGPAGTLWSLREGMGQLVEALAARLAERPGVELRTGEAVLGIARREAAGWTVMTRSGGYKADAVVLACPSFAQAEVTDGLDAELSRMLASIPYTPVVVVALAFRCDDLPCPLDGFGYLSPQRTRRDVLGVLWSSSIFDNRAPPGMQLIQAMCGGWNRRDILAWEDERIESAVREELRATMGITAPPAFTRVIRWDQAIPQYHRGHLERVRQIEARRGAHPGLYLTGNSFRGIAVNDCTEEAVRCAQEVVHDLTSTCSGAPR